MSFLPNTNGSQSSDKELANLYKDTGEMGVLGELYSRYMELVFGVCLKYFKDQETAKDAVMQVFEELVLKLRKHSVENFRPWLHQVAKNYCLMQLRTPRNLKTVEFNPDLMQNEEPVHLNGVLEKEEGFRRLEGCLDQLVPDQQKAIRLFYMEGKCYNEIVEETGLPWNQVRSFIQNGRRNLKNCMEKELNGQTSEQKN